MIQMQSAVAGYYHISAMRPDGSVRVLADWFPNLITDAGLDMIGSVRSAPGPFQVLCVGGGSTPPANGNTALQTWIANANSSTTISTGAQSSPPYYGWQRKQYMFNAGVAAGTLTELGVGRTETDLFSRALIVDALGAPTSIVVLSDEVLYIVYEFRMYPPTGDVLATEDIDGVSTDIIIRACNVTNQQWWAHDFGVFVPGISSFQRYYSGTIGAITAGPSGTIGSGSGPTEQSYTPGSYTRTYSTSCGLNEANIGGIRSITRATGVGGFQMQFTPAINKDATRTLLLTTGQSWTRYAP